MRVFLSHSSVDRAIVVNVHDSLGKETAWLDRAEIEWGDLFLERVALALEESTEFLLFWSAHSARSGWVRLELNMAFIRMMEEQAIRLRVVKLDETDIPLYLKPFQFLDVSESETLASDIVDAINGIADIPKRVLRHRFLNRNEELSRMEAAVDDAETHLVVISGFAGIGKESIAREGLRRFFQGAQVVTVDVSEGTGLTELALYLNALARSETLEEGLALEELRTQLRLSIEAVARSKQFLLLTNIQHWLDNNRVPIEPLVTVLDCIASVPDFRNRPCLMTSTRRISFRGTRDTGTTDIWLDGLDAKSVAVLVKLWYELNTGIELSETDANSVAEQVYGHPIASKLAASLVAQFGAEYLSQYPREYVSLRRDLATSMLLDMQLHESTSAIMKALAAVEIPLPPAVLTSALGIDSEEFHKGISQATSAGLVFAAEGRLGIHPLIAEHFWMLLHREDYSAFLAKLADEVHSFANSCGVGSRDFILLLPVIFRLHASAGNWDMALRLRSDLQGEIERAAIFHYRRRNYDLAWEYVLHALEGAHSSWSMKLYKARILIRKEKWSEADQVVAELLKDRPNDVSALHVKGWKLLRQRRYEDALQVFLKVVAQRDHVASLRDSAECLHKLDRDEEALELLARAKNVESENPYVLDLEARIFEERGDLESAYRAAYIAMVRDPNNWAFHHRLGRILVSQRKQREAIDHLQRAIELDQDQFIPHSGLIAALLDIGQVERAEDLLESLCEKASTRRDRSLVEHLKARILIEKGDIEEGSRLLEREISRRRNLLPNLGLYAGAKLREYDKSRLKYPTTSAIALEKAANAIKRGLELEENNAILLDLQQRVEAICRNPDSPSINS